MISFPASPKDADQNTRAKMTYELKPSGFFYQGNKCQHIGLAPVGFDVPSNGNTELTF